MLRRVWQGAKYGSMSTIVFGYYACYVDRPFADESLDGTDHVQNSRTFPELCYAPAQAVTFTLTTMLNSLWAQKLNTFTSFGAEKLEGVVAHRKKGQSLITVMNHSSTCDDPTILINLLPPKHTCLPFFGRWTLCSQEYCFQKGAAVSMLSFSGKALPIKRGAGIDHVFLEEFFKKVQDGKWVNIFPEAKIVQGGYLGGREDKAAREKIGRLKWGVGKLIARAEVPPVVVPIYHLGMDKILPQDEKMLRSMIPKTGQDVIAIVGDPIDFEDLLAQYRQKVGDSNEEINSWKTIESEKEFYSAITRRIEDALLDLEQQAHQEQDKQTKEFLNKSAARHRERLHAQDLAADSRKKQQK